MKNIFLAPGPSELYFTVEDHIRNALKQNIGSISHRSNEFKEIFEESTGAIRELLQVPENFHVVFTGSANEIWERILQNCVIDSSFHFVNGSFSKKFYSFANDLNLNSSCIEKPLGEGFSDISNISIPSEAELISVTQNETSSGVQMPLDEIYKLKDKYPDKLLVVDAVSALPFISFDYNKIDSIYFSVQKGFGLPAGLGVWIFNDKMVEKSLQKQEKGHTIGTYHSIPKLIDQEAKNMTPETPNTLGIYLLGKVCKDMLRKGMDTIRNETIYKSTLLYSSFSGHKILKPAVKQSELRSQTVVVFDVLEGNSQDVIDKFKPQGLLLGKGYGNKKDSQIRIANFPTHSKEIFERIVDTLAN